MNNKEIDILEYKGYSGTVEFSVPDRCFHGRVIGITHLFTYEGNSFEELENDFRGCIEDYLYDCEKERIVPQKPFKGTFNIRLSPDSHKKAVLTAKRRNISLNSFVKQAIEHELER